MLDIRLKTCDNRENQKISPCKGEKVVVEKKKENKKNKEPRINDMAGRLLDKAMLLGIGESVEISRPTAAQRNTLVFYLNSTRKALKDKGEPYGILRFTPIDRPSDPASMVRKIEYIVQIKKMDEVSVPFTKVLANGARVQDEVGIIFREKTIRDWYEQGLTRKSITTYLGAVAPEEKDLLDKLFPQGDKSETLPVTYGKHER